MAATITTEKLDTEYVLMKEQHQSPAKAGEPAWGQLPQPRCQLAEERAARHRWCSVTGPVLQSTVRPGKAGRRVCTARFRHSSLLSKITLQCPHHSHAWVTSCNKHKEVTRTKVWNSGHSWRREQTAFGLRYVEGLRRGLANSQL